MTAAPDPAGPVAVFDSGVGGLSVLLEIRRQLPHEDLLYAADSGHAPYGDKPARVIEERAHAIVDFFVRQGAKAVVVACNTATGIAVDALRSRWPMPIVGIEPAIKPAVAATKSGVVGVLATSQTIASARFARLIETFGGGVEVLPQPCPGIVEQVEQGEADSEQTRTLLAGYVGPLIARGADTLVLGCTHYPFVAAAIQAIAGPGVLVINPAAAVARELRRRLEQHALVTPSARAGTMAFWTSGAPGRLQEVLRSLGIEGGDVQQLP